MRAAGALREPWAVKRIADGGRTPLSYSGVAEYPTTSPARTLRATPFSKLLICGELAPLCVSVTRFRMSLPEQPSCRS